MSEAKQINDDDIPLTELLAETMQGNEDEKPSSNEVDNDDKMLVETLKQGNEDEDDNNHNHNTTTTSNDVDNNEDAETIPGELDEPLVEGEASNEDDKKLTDEPLQVNEASNEDDKKKRLKSRCCRVKQALWMTRN